MICHYFCSVSEVSVFGYLPKFLEYLYFIQSCDSNTNHIPSVIQYPTTAIAGLKCCINLDVGVVVSDAGERTDDAHRFLSVLLAKTIATVRLGANVSPA